MSKLSRRHFLQFAGATLATLGLSKWERYGKVLAQDTPRKVALLVGINKYQYAGPLEGCVNDVFMQQELLINRFGFNPKDIHILLDEKATREGILGAFEEYLINQVKPGDIAVYHYSGHGSLIFDPDPIVSDPNKKESNLNGTFVPFDATPREYIREETIVEDIMGHTLYLLMSAVPTENFTAVLDSCFSGAATKNDFRIRSRLGGEKTLVSPKEKTYQEQWLSKLNLSPEEFIAGYREGVAKGVVIASTNPNQYAADVRLNGFYAGIFTHTFTQYLWQENTTPEEAVAYTVEKLANYFKEKDFRQTPTLEVEVDTDYGQQPVYFNSPTRSAAHGAVIKVENNQAKFWLGGIDPGKLEPGMQFKVVDKQGLVTYRDRNGLLAFGNVEGSVSSGDLLLLNSI
ncbi:MAG: caspase family protein [Spirulinaceae cyanobacterium]